MHKSLSIILLLMLSASVFGQSIGIVDKKSKGFFIVGDQKIKYLVFGYQFPNPTTRKMICFSDNADNLRANYECPLGAYFDTGKMNPGDHILFLGFAGPYGKMAFIPGSGRNTVFYLPKSSFTIR